MVKSPSEQTEHNLSRLQADDPTSEPSQLVEGEAFPIVGIGASAGGLEAFTELLKHLPLDTGMGFVLVQHLDPLHESALAQILTRATLLPVHEVTNNLRAEPDHVYIIPPNTSLAIVQGVLKLERRRQTSAPPRSIDFFLESLARDQRERAIGIILSGTASDGTLGLEAIKAEGGLTFAQDSSARYDSMPRNAAAAGCVDFVGSPEHIAKELARIAKHPHLAGQPGELLTWAEDDPDPSSAMAHEDDHSSLLSGERGMQRRGTKQVHSHGEAITGKPGGNGFKKILLLLRNHCGVDFSYYKPSTIRRRITRRMVLSKHDSLENYLDQLRGNTKELDALYSDALISVTSFFRNPEAFEILKRKVFPRLLQQRGDEPVRAWVLGCSTGQEAYSVAMAFVESTDKASRIRKLQVFATDLNEALLDRARHGLYAKSLVQEVTPERLRRFFVEEEGGYRIAKPLREMVVFARQNLTSDPPFSRMDLISCRNLLIYLEPSLHKKALPVFHYALKPEGFLLLGASESIGSFTDLFEPVDKKQRIYSKKPGLAQLPVKKARNEQPPAVSPRKATLSVAMDDAQGEAVGRLPAELNAQREADRVTVNRFAPPGVVINTELQILQFRGATAAYLEPPTGNASFDVLKMAKKGLMLPLRAAINQAKKENKTAHKENVRLQENGKTRRVNVEVVPLKNLRERCFLILFEEAENSGRTLNAPRSKQAEPRRGKRGVQAAASEESRRVTDLESELTETRDYLQSIQEQHEAANEELQASNEEVQSANEELQSINEELETSKEELEAANEELTTVNEEMAHRNTELNRLNNDLLNIQTSAQLAIVLLGRDLTIRRFSAEAKRLLGLEATNIGRSFISVWHNLVFEERRLPVNSAIAKTPPAERRQLDRHGGLDRIPQPMAFSSPEMERLITQVITTDRESEREMRDKMGHWYSLRVRPYLTFDNKVDGAVLVLVDITELKRTEQTTVVARNYAEAIIQTARDPLVILNADHRVHTANKAFYETFKVSPPGTEGHSLYELGNNQWQIPKLQQLLEEILIASSSFDDFEVTHNFEKIGPRTMMLNARALRDTDGDPARILLGIQDVTESLSFQAARENAEKFKLLFERSPLPKWVVDLETLRFVDVNETAVEHYGYSREEFLGMSVLEVRTPEAGEALQAALARPPHRPSERDTCQHRKKNGEVIDVEVRSNECLLAGKRVWLASITDITERKRAEQTLRRAAEFDEAVMANMGEGLYTVDAHGLVTFLNPAAERLFGWTLEELRGKKMHEMTHYKHGDGRPYPAEECPGLHVLKGGKTLADHEDAFIRKDGTFFDVVYSSSPLYEGNTITGLVVVFRDVSERKRMEKTLRKSEQRFAQFMRHLPALAWIKDSHGRYVFANDAAERVFGKRGPELYGKTDQELFPPETANQFVKNDQRALASESGLQTVETLAHADASLRHSIVSKFPVLGPDDKEIMVGGVAFDITERKQAEEAQKELTEQLAGELAATQELQHTSTQLIREGDPKALYQQIVKAAVTIMHSDMASIQMVDEGQDALRLLASEGFDSAFGQIFESNGPDTETTGSAARRAGHRVIVPDVESSDFIIGTALQNYRKIGIRAVQSTPLISRDASILGVVSTYWRNPHQPAERHLRLLDILARQAADFIERARAEESMREADHRKNEFLAMLAHELRNPLAPIRNSLEILRRAQGNWKAVQSASEMMDRQISHMVRLVDDLLDVSRISRGKIELRKDSIQLASVVNQAVESAGPLLKSKGLDLTVTLPPRPVHLNADPVRLAQVMGNLLNNAAKFSEKGGCVWLNAELADERHQSAEEVLIRVRDTGIGISADQLARIFDMFNQVDTSLERSTGGLGIGLTLAKTLVELHGGTLEAYSAGIGQGSEFVVRLPILVEAPKPLQAEPTGSEPSVTIMRRVLVVDDNRDSVEFLTMLLNLIGYQTDTALDGLQAVEAAARFRPDVVLLDIGLPKLNGYEVARKIREQAWGKDMVLVALTGWGQEEDRHRSQEAGFNHHLTKPVHPDTLSKLLAQLPMPKSAHSGI